MPTVVDARSTFRRQLPRFGFAVSCVLAPKAAAWSIGERAAEVTPAAESFAGLVATRATTLGILELSAPALDAGLRRKVLLLIAAVDGVDVITAARAAQRYLHAAAAMRAQPQT